MRRAARQPRCARGAGAGGARAHRGGQRQAGGESSQLFAVPPDALGALKLIVGQLVRRRLHLAARNTHPASRPAPRRRAASTKGGCVGEGRTRGAGALMGRRTTRAAARKARCTRGKQAQRARTAARACEVGPSCGLRAPAAYRRCPQRTLQASSCPRRAPLRMPRRCLTMPQRRRRRSSQRARRGEPRPTRVRTGVAQARRQHITPALFRRFMRC